MTASKDDTENSHWRATSPEQRSYLVEILHWFHYRTPALKRSWTREEPLTWELIRALEILPRSLFLRLLLRAMGRLSAETQTAVAPLLESSVVRVFRYPSLGLRGVKRNCRADIGFGVGDQATVWLEAKTAPFRAVDLENQLEQQRLAMAAFIDNGPSALITLLPASQALASTPNLSWDSVIGVLEDGLAELRGAIHDPDLRRGYDLVAIEMIQRIKSHPGGLVAQQIAPPGLSASPRDG